MARNEITAEAHRNDQYFLDGKILPELHELDVAEISYDTLEWSIAKIGSDLSASSIQHYLGVCTAEGAEAKWMEKEPKSIPLPRTVAVATAAGTGPK